MTLILFLLLIVSCVLNIKTLGLLEWYKNAWLEEIKRNQK